MRRLEKLEPSVFHVRNITSHQFELESIAVVCAAKQYCLVHKLHARLAVAEYRLDDVVGFGITVFDRDVARFGSGLVFGEEVLAILPFALRDKTVSYVQNFLCGAVILIESHGRCGRHELIRKAENIFDIGCAKRVNRLRIITNHSDTLTFRLQRTQDLCLHDIRVLVFVDQHMIEPCSDLPRKLFISNQVVPVEQQIVIVEHLTMLLARDVVPE